MLLAAAGALVVATTAPLFGPQGSDEELVGAVAQGHPPALELIYQRYGGPIYVLARRVLVDDSLAEEVVQEVFLKLWQEPERFDPQRGALRSFLYRQAHSRAVEWIRAEEARRRREDRHDRENLRMPDDLETEAWQLIRSELVKEAVAELSEGEREAITLAYFGGKSYREVAALLDVPEGTIKSRINRARNLLREVLGEAV